MGHDRISGETACQCLVRERNEVIERANVARPAGVERARLHCECGDSACGMVVALTHAEYEDVRAFGSHFLIGINHENPESTCVLSENEGFAVVDVLSPDARYAVLARHTRHAWVDPRDGSGS